MNETLRRLCAAHGIEPVTTGFDGIARDVPEATLAALAEALGLDGAPPQAAGSIAAVRREAGPVRCHLPSDLAGARMWGIACQLPSLASAQNAGMGDFADLAELCRVAAAEGADFVGVNPLHALFWSDPGRVSPFFPSNRRFLNPLYIALQWLPGYEGLTDREAAQAARCRDGAVVPVAAVAALKRAVLRRHFESFPRDEAQRRAFAAFRERGGDALEAHALFEAISSHHVARGGGATPPDWPERFRSREARDVASFAANHRDDVDFHLWLQWVAAEQRDRLQRAARAAGMRIGLYCDFAVGEAPDGSAAWTDPAMTVPQLSIGAPPDPFSDAGQDWELAPLSPVRLAAADGGPFGDTLADVMRDAGALRIDHAMGIARLWLIPRGAPATDGAYVRYPLGALLRRLGEASQEQRVLVIGEDLGLVPNGFRELLAERTIHGYRVYFFERDRRGYAYPERWPADALACTGTHDLPSFPAWWEEADLGFRAAAGVLPKGQEPALRRERKRERRALVRQLGGSAGDVGDLSLRLHRRMASSPCRLAVLQIEDALGLSVQVNLPGTVDEHPNWVQRLPVAVERLGDDPSFLAHTAAMRAARPR